MWGCEDRLTAPHEWTDANSSLAQGFETILKTELLCLGVQFTGPLSRPGFARRFGPPGFPRNRSSMNTIFAEPLASSFSRMTVIVVLLPLLKVGSVHNCHDEPLHRTPATLALPQFPALTSRV